jgi:hypothetical protein
MSAGNSIIFKMGGDVSGLQKDMQEAERIVVRETKRAKAEMDSVAKYSETLTRKLGSGGGSGGGGGGKGGHGGGGGSNNRMIGDLLDSATGQKGWVMRMNMLSHSLPIAAVAGAVIGVEKMQEALEKVTEANKEARAELAKPVNVAVAMGAESVKANLENIEETKKKLQESRSFAATMGDMVLNPLKGLGNKLSGQKLFKTDGMEDSLKLEAQLDERRFELSAKLTAQTKEDTADRTTALHHSREELAIFETELKTREKIAKLQADNTLLPDAKKSGIDQAKQEGADAREAAELALSRRIIENSAQAGINAEKKEGSDVEIKSLQTRIAAEKELALFSGNDQDAYKHNNTADALQVELDAAKLVTAERKAQQAIEIEVAGFQGDADARHALMLDRENANLIKRLADAKPDAKGAISVDLAKNEQAKLAFASAQVRKNAAARDTEIDGMPGEGAMAHAQRTQAHLANARAEQTAINADPSSSRQDKAGAAKKVKDLSQEMKDYYRTTQETNDAAAEGTAELQQQLAHHEQIAEAMKTQFEYQTRIVDAERNGNSEQANQLRTQQGLALGGQVQKLSRQVGDKSKATIAELAAHAFNADGQDARKAQRLEKRANTERMRGHSDTADDLQDQADQIKKSIPGLKDSDKQDSVQRDQLTALKSIDDKIGGVRNAK